MITSTKSLEDTTNAKRIIASGATGLYDFYKIKYIKSIIVQGISQTIPSSAPTQADVLDANEGLDSDVENYVANYFPFDVNYINNPSFLCYEVNRDIVSPSSVNVLYLYAKVDVYQVVQSTNNLIVK